MRSAESKRLTLRQDSSYQIQKFFVLLVYLTRHMSTSLSGNYGQPLKVTYDGPVRGVNRTKYECLSALRKRIDLHDRRNGLIDTWAFSTHLISRRRRASSDLIQQAWCRVFRSQTAHQAFCLHSRLCIATVVR